MDQLPIDTSHPAVREYLALVRLQVLTPLSLLINIACVATCAFVASPSLSSVSKLYPTALTPNSAVIASYVAALYVGQIGYCVMLVLTRSAETKRAYVNAIGLFLPFANLFMALWAIAWVMRWFLLATILQGLILLLLLFSNVALFIYHPPEHARPLGIAFVHAPLRFFLVLPFSILFELSLFVALGLSYEPTSPGAPPRDYSSWHAMAGFGVVLGTNLASLIVVVSRSDLVWCAAATWIAVSIWSASPKPAPVYITAITFTALHPLAYIFSKLYARCCSPSARRNRNIVLPGDQTAHPGLYGATSTGAAATARARQNGGEIETGPTEVDAENWG
ncbi:hypothetical protein BDN70DRAFT_871014 [Pholiota conissans]|uniref:Uncharacterized protein n=1 Tax=Pholiota conissans TaxID=109636 RepID=A0A9P6CZX1_9AGAR|nr:hypothetical protein BDN70DRAFT_871014 [Pholiota conissans]